jgi:hypothetical protein
LAQPTNHRREKNLPMHPEAPTYSALRIRAGFVPPPRSMFERDARPRRSDDCFGLHRQVGTGLLTRGIGCSFQLADWRSRKSRARQASRRRGRLRTEVVTSAPNGAFWRAACLATLCFRLTMSRWRIYSAAIATRAARKFCPDAIASEQFPPAPLPFPFPCFSISSIDAPRGAVRWRRCRPPCIFARGERVYHGKQNDHRRFPPGGNQGSGASRKSRRGV